MGASALELLYDYFEDHVRLAGVVRESQPIGLGVMGFLVGGLSLFVAQALTNRLHVLSFSWTSLIIVLLWKVTAGFLLASVIHLFLELQGLKGNAVSLFILFGLADVSWALVVPLILLARAFSHSSLLVSVIFLAVGFLSLSLKARSLQDEYKISTGRAWFMLGLPFFLAVSAALLLVSLLILKAILAAGALLS